MPRIVWIILILMIFGRRIFLRGNMERDVLTCFCCPPPAARQARADVAHESDQPADRAARKWRRATRRVSPS